MANQPSPPLVHYKAADFSRPVETELRLPYTTMRLFPSRSGRLLGLTNLYGGRAAEVWDRSSQQRIAELPAQFMVEWLDFTSNEEQILLLGGQQVEARNLADGAKAGVYLLPHAGRHSAAMHPSGLLVVGDSMGCLMLIDLAAGDFRKTLYVGGKRDLRAQMRQQAQAAQDALAQVVDPNWINEMREAMALQLERFRAQLQKKGMKGLLPDGLDVDQWAKQLEQSIAASRQRIEELARQAESDEPLKVPSQGLEAISCLALSDDGQWLGCGTSEGVRLFAWEEILAAEETPRPLYQASSPPFKLPGEFAIEMPTVIQALAFAPGKLLFAGEEGVVRYLNLDDGASGMMLDAPRRHGIVQMALSGDGRALACVCRSLDPTANGRCALQIWNYAILEARCRAAS